MNKNKELFEKSETYIPGGVNSPVRAFGSVGGAFALINSIFSSKDIALTIKKLKLKI